MKVAELIQLYSTNRFHNGLTNFGGHRDYQKKGIEQSENNSFQLFFLTNI